MKWNKFAVHTGPKNQFDILAYFALKRHFQFIKQENKLKSQTYSQIQAVKILAIAIAIAIARILQLN